MKDYLNFTGRETGNISRTRRNLLKTLREMKDETYEYSYIKENRQLEESFLSLVSEAISTEYNGNATVKVQLGATLNNGRNATNKINDFENEPMRIILNHNNNDFDKIDKAHNTYLKNKKKYNKTTKK